MSLQEDLRALSTGLLEVETAGRSLPWAKRRPWRTQSHLGQSNGLPMVDLHDLSVKLALEVVQICSATALSTGGVVFITGRGKHTAGQSPLRDAVWGRLQSGDGEMRALGPGRVEVIFDSTKAKAARPGLGLMFWLLVALGLVGLATVVLNRLP